MRNDGKMVIEQGSPNAMQSTMLTPILLPWTTAFCFLDSTSTRVRKLLRTQYLLQMVLPYTDHGESLCVRGQINFEKTQIKSSRS